MRRRTLLARESTPWTATNSLCAGEYSTIKRDNRSGQQNSSRFSITFKFSSSSNAKRRRPIDNVGRKRRTNRPLSRGVSSISKTPNQALHHDRGRTYKKEEVKTNLPRGRPRLSFDSSGAPIRRKKSKQIFHGDAQDSLLILQGHLVPQSTT